MDRTRRTNIKGEGLFSYLTIGPYLNPPVHK